MAEIVLMRNFDRADSHTLAPPLYVSGIPADVILQIFKIHAYETDFRQRVLAAQGSSAP